LLLADPGRAETDTGRAEEPALVAVVVEEGAGDEGGWEYAVSPAGTQGTHRRSSAVQRATLPRGEPPCPTAPPTAPAPPLAPATPVIRAAAAASGRVAPMQVSAAHNKRQAQRTHASLAVSAAASSRPLAEDQLARRTLEALVVLALDSTARKAGALVVEGLSGAGREAALELERQAALADRAAAAAATRRGGSDAAAATLGNAGAASVAGVASVSNPSAGVPLQAAAPTTQLAGGGPSSGACNAGMASAPLAPRACGTGSGADCGVDIDAILGAQLGAAHAIAVATERRARRQAAALVRSHAVLTCVTGPLRDCRRAQNPRAGTSGRHTTTRPSGALVSPLRSLTAMWCCCGSTCREPVGTPRHNKPAPAFRSPSRPRQSSRGAATAGDIGHVSGLEEAPRSIELTGPREGPMRLSVAAGSRRASKGSGGIDSGSFRRSHSGLGGGGQSRPSSAHAGWLSPGGRDASEPQVYTDSPLLRLLSAAEAGSSP